MVLLRSPRATQSPSRLLLCADGPRRFCGNRSGAPADAVSHTLAAFTSSPPDPDGCYMPSALGRAEQPLFSTSSAFGTRSILLLLARSAVAGRATALGLVVDRSLAWPRNSGSPGCEIALRSLLTCGQGEPRYPLLCAPRGAHSAPVQYRRAVCSP